MMAASRKSNYPAAVALVCEEGGGGGMRQGAGGGTVGVAVAVACSNSNKYCQNTCQMAKQWSWDVVRARCTLLFQKKGDIN